MAYSALRNLRKTALNLVKYELGKVSPLPSENTIARSLWCLCRKPDDNSSFSRSTSEQAKLHKNIYCQTNKYVHTKSDQELVHFLAEEIIAETKTQKLPSLPKIEGFDIKTDGAAVTLTKKFQSENIKVKFNVNHTVDTDSEDQPPQDSKEPEMAELKSKPAFTVEIEKGGTVLGFTCSFIHDQVLEEGGDSEEYRDLFNIDEVVFHNGEWKDNTYSVSSEIIDGYLYDLLMTYLEERGISSEFADKLSNFSTSYEHKMYISLLENLKAFVNGDVLKVMDRKVSHQQK